ncbi:uncharacterized protein CANTADRAFT_34912, partial [Suhomyces tanzawaensis NRRL Y-17324]
ELPTRWHSLSLGFLSRPEVIFGLQHTRSQYTFYLTNFEHVWVEVADKTQLIAKGRQFGFEDLNTSKMMDLIQLLANLDQHKEADFALDGDDIKLLKNDVHWVFQLAKQPVDVTVQFLRELNMQQFQNHSLLLEKIGDLKHSIEIKDTYSRFLVENFKLSHGMDLISDYKRNNKRDAEFLEPFRSETWEK